MIIKHAPDLEGLLYFASCYFPSVFIWNEKVGYDARFAPDDNLFHRGLELLHLVILGTVVSHIREVSLMKMTSENATTMIFAGALFVECWVHVKKYFDVVHNVDGGNEAKINARDDAYRKMFVSVFYCIAFALAGWDFFGHHNLEGNNLPIIFCLIGSSSEHAVALMEAFVIIPARKVDHHEVRVPLNLEFTLHRFAEWVMLMLGESILSLLVVDITGTVAYYATLFWGIVSVTMLQYLYYRSNPHEPEEHALRRSVVGGFGFFYSIIFYSASLILVGVCYKMMLTVYFEEEEAGLHRVLHLPLPFDEYKQRISSMYGYALSSSLVFLDAMLLSHLGAREFFSRFYYRRRGRPNIKAFVFSAMTLSTTILSLFCGNICGTNLVATSLFGLTLVVFQVLVRTQAMKIFWFGEEKECAWPNVTEARSVPCKSTTP
mmetsp:Transcript_7369/g.10818  ORF Transcript_7369/g.10818 Transcript_7369/m.10818 type:complete len:433 (+) Transcript_7369:52-1350(+)